ncbi:2-nitropropane dioxygenase [Prolixibacter bellariivorans]|uniref:2-nitropropane dioxygenase n=1 Tax=Prolixibacter bellariivorans TaxID=314319 RepID=A0A5M4AV18_9BACT|nr:nitronate monooxygenase [Prolixibacter bellariivorans]GET31795.1 2-nitropropane dioxygenase [Prolixibacter bellariivorans]
MAQNKIGELFNIEFPIIQAGMVWCSGWRLASAVSNHGGLGIIGAGSMHPDTLEEHIRKARKATSKPFGVNVPLLYPEMDKVMDILIREKVEIVFTSAGNPKKWTPFLKEHGMTVVHVVSSAKFALKAEEAGVDAVVAEGFEAGGHNGREETTTMTLIPAVRRATKLPLIAAGGIGTGAAMVAAMALGADGVQIGSRFAVAEESSAHRLFKQRVVDAVEGDTKLMLKKLAPVRLMKNHFFDLVSQAEERCDDADELRTLLGKGRSRKGIFEGDMEDGELEIGQVSSIIDRIQPVSEIMEELINDYRKTLETLQQHSPF